MIDSLMPLSDASVLPTDRREQSAKRSSIESEVPRCKKRKKTLQWTPKKCSRDSAKKFKCSNKKGRPKPEAPFNSTQFIMDEHDNLNDSDLSTVPLHRRDSSPSMDSDDLSDDSWHHGPSYEQESFMTQQFWSTYHDLNAERLYGLSKAQLVQEYFAVEEKLNSLERELDLARTQDRARQRIREPSPGGEEVPPGEVPVDAETAAKIEVFRNEINKLSLENETLRIENEDLHTKTSKSSCRHCAINSNSSADEGSSSSSSSDSFDSDASSGECSKNRKLLLTKLSPPSVEDDESSLYERSNVALQSERVVKTTLDFVSDSGIASASSGDDLRLEEREDALEDKIDPLKEVQPIMKSPVISAT